MMLATVLLAVANAGAQPSETESFRRWDGDKYSMFIHFGLYSHLGGVWDGEPVTQGYSEQIQSFGGIFGDWYAETAYEFDPQGFDARHIVSLAKDAGMRSVVFTSKHHDGFCMFDTETTDYNSVDMTPAGRDYVREISEACAEAGLKFGLYFSLIDWNYPHAYPISSHNADFVTPQHHEFNKAQVRELLTSYGPVSELWFDMGSLEPQQSRELYALVKELQPDCMVSGRLGNDVYDFAVMADNRLPDVALQAPWQSAASMFPETWSYRSWQERGEVSDKVAEKMRSLIDVVSRGGNYLLNIGPDPRGEVVPFERDVLLAVGAWLKENGDAIYDTESSPFRGSFDWGAVTRKGNRLYLLLSGTCPEDGLVRLSMPGFRLKKAEGAKARMKGGECVVEVTGQMYADPTDVHVVALEFNREIPASMAVESVPEDELLSWANATPDYSYSCFDYYSNYRSAVAYNWNVEFESDPSYVYVYYTESDLGRNVRMTVGGTQVDFVLDDAASVSCYSDAVAGNYSLSRMRGGTFDRAYDSAGLRNLKDDMSWVIFKDHGFSNHVLSCDVDNMYPQIIVFEVVAGNGAELLVDGRTMMKHLNPYRSASNLEYVLLWVPEGRTELVLRSYNRFEKEVECRLRIAHRQPVFRKRIELPETEERNPENVPVRIEALDMQSPHSDCRLHNLILEF